MIDAILRGPLRLCVLRVEIFIRKPPSDVWTSAPNAGIAISIVRLFKTREGLQKPAFRGPSALSGMSARWEQGVWRQETLAPKPLTPKPSPLADIFTNPASFPPDQILSTPSLKRHANCKPQGALTSSGGRELHLFHGGVTSIIHYKLFIIGNLRRLERFCGLMGRRRESFSNRPFGVARCGGE